MNAPHDSSVLNIDALLAPIRADSPSGEDLRYSEIYDRIQEARRSDDQLEQGEWRTDIKTANWREVARLGGDTLARTSKDLRVAVWLTEAWGHLHGFAGLKAGFDLIRGLLTTFWPTVHPLMEDGDMEYRITPLMLLNEKLPALIFQTPLCDPEHTAGYGYYQWEESRLVGLAQSADNEQKKRRETLMAEGKISGEAFASAINAGSVTFYRDLSRDLAQCKASLAALDDVVTECFAPNPPGFTQLTEAFETCARVVNGIYQGKRKSQVAPPEAPGDDASDDSAAVAVQTHAVRQMPHGSVEPCTTGAIEDIRADELALWRQVSRTLADGGLKEAMDALLAKAALSPSIREKNRYHLLLAKLCLNADRADLARPIAEEIYKLIESLQLEQWEHPCWIAEVVETLYRCLIVDGKTDSERARGLFEKLCLLNVTKAAAYRTA
ncbi:MAG: type VI secretion system protein TssA [Desulfatitalea sp.]|nr:type VI secretion system protein TssA [Desulfatitalea sp.]NNK00538.1 type VI secretion system protein TssA [Desulfatitalea sp.]